MGSGLPDLGRFSEPALLILLSLADGDKHGYAIMEDVKQIAGVHLGPGTLYGALARLEKRGLIDPVASDNRRRPYHLTAGGHVALYEALESMKRLVTTGFERLPAT